MGRPRKSAEVRKAEGNRGHRDIPNEPVATGSPLMPRWFDDQRASLWLEIVDQAPKGVLKSADSVAVETLVEALIRLRQARAQLDAEGLTIRGERGGTVKHPLITIISSAERTVADLSNALGLSPAARTRLTVKVENGADDALSPEATMEWLCSPLPMQELRREEEQRRLEAAKKHH